MAIDDLEDLIYHLTNVDVLLVLVSLGFYLIKLSCNISIHEGLYKALLPLKY